MTNAATGTPIQNQPQERHRHAAIAFDGLVILRLRRRRMSLRDRVVRELPHELVDRHLGIEADLEGVRADDAPAEDAARQALDVVPLERLERDHRDLGGVGNLAERKAATLAGLAQLVAESACAFLCDSCAGYIFVPPHVKPSLEGGGLPLLSADPDLREESNG